MGDVVTIVRPLGPGDEALALATMREMFGAPGRYRIEPLIKAVDADPVDEWEAWFMRRLHEATRREFIGARAAIWEVLDDTIQRAGVTVPSELDYWTLQETLFDLTNASTARMVGLDVPRPVRRRLSRLGWSEREVLDFPALAYRFGRLYSELQRAGEVTQWDDLVEHARSYPLSTLEQATVENIRRHAGQHLRPIMDQAGNVWTAEREIEPLREVLERHVKDRTGAREAARELGRTARAEGNFRDMDRVARTELAETTHNAAWDERSKDWKPETRVFRQPTRNACKGCLRLLKSPDGMPRIYLAPEVEAQDALGYNTGSWRNWHLRRGTIHPNCHPKGAVLDRPADLRATTARFYEGDLVTIRTAGGRHLTVTPNHPVLTERGWVPASEVHQVGHVVTGSHRERMALCDADEEHVPTLVEDLRDTLGPQALMFRFSGSPNDFHGDGSDNEIDLVLQNRLSPGVVEPCGSQHGGELFVTGTGRSASSALDIGLCGDCLSLRRRHPHAGGTLQPTGQGVPADAVLSRETYDRLAGLVPPSGFVEDRREPVPWVPDDDTAIDEAALENTVMDSVPATELLHRFAGFVERDQVVQVDSVRFAGHVYSLETESHAYVAAGVVVHNCVCPPWSRWLDSMRPSFEADAAEWAATMKRLRVFQEAA